MAKTISEQTGWNRPFPVAICQDFDVLAKVTDYDFDLFNKEFQGYCLVRGVLYKAGIEERFNFTGNHSANKEDFLRIFRYAIEYPERSGQRYRFADSEMEAHWEIMLAAKGAIQDCWELFQENKGEMK